MSASQTKLSASVLLVVVMMASCAQAGLYYKPFFKSYYKPYYKPFFGGGFMGHHYSPFHHGLGSFGFGGGVGFGVGGGFGVGAGLGLGNVGLQGLLYNNIGINSINNLALNANLGLSGLNTLGLNSLGLNTLGLATGFNNLGLGVGFNDFDDDD